MLFSIYKFSASATTQNALRLIGERLRNYRPFRDTLDILLVAAILFAVWFFTRKSRVAHFIGLFVICWVLLTFISSLLDLSVFSYILRYLMQSALLGTIVILMMRLLDHLGRVGDFPSSRGSNNSLPKREKTTTRANRSTPSARRRSTCRATGPAV